MDWERFRIPCRIPEGLNLILPEAVKRNRFFADDFVFILGILSPRIYEVLVRQLGMPREVISPATLSLLNRAVYNDLCI